MTVEGAIRRADWTAKRGRAESRRNDRQPGRPFKTGAGAREGSALSGGSERRPRPSLAAAGTCTAASRVHAAMLMQHSWIATYGYRSARSRPLRLMLSVFCISLGCCAQQGGRCFWRRARGVAGALHGLPRYLVWDKALRHCDGLIQTWRSRRTLGKAPGSQAATSWARQGGQPPHINCQRARTFLPDQLSPPVLQFLPHPTTATTVWCDAAPTKPSPASHQPPVTSHQPATNQPPSPPCTPALPLLHPRSPAARTCRISGSCAISGTPSGRAATAASTSTRTAPVFGTQCLGAGGNHKELKVADICDDCKVRKIMFVGRRATLDNWGKDDPFRHGNRRP